MSYLVDANVLSEPTKVSPDPTVVRWLVDNQEQLFVDPIVLGEIQFGILRLPRGRKRASLQGWFDEVVGRVRCVSMEAPAGLRWADLVAGLRRRGLSMPLKDSIIAANALTHGLTLATRNVRDFEPCGVPLLNPFEHAGGEVH